MPLQLDPPDSFALSAAVGWLELDNPREGELELDGISPENQSHPGVLEVRFLIHSKRLDWASALEAARRMVEVAPEFVSGWMHRAYATRRAPGGSVSAAWDALLPAAERFPKDELVRFNLACYACQMENLDQARHWLQEAMRTGGKAEIKSMALRDDDLKPLWPEIEGM